MLFVLASFSGCYLTGIMPVSPIYFSAILAAVLIPFMYTGIGTYFGKPLLFALAIIVLTAVFGVVTEAEISATLGMIMTFFTFILMSVYTYNVSISRCEKALRIFVLCSVAILAVEAYVRISNPQFVHGDVDYLAGSESNLFYAYKLNSIMFLDSNFVGLFAIAVYFAARFLKERNALYGNVLSRIILAVCFTLVILSLSRASIITLLLMAVYYRVRSKIYLFSLFVPVLYLISNSISGDTSYDSKQEILSLTWLALQSIPFPEVLLGVGFGNSINRIGIGAHNIFVVLFYEGGLLIGLLCFYFYIYIFKNSPSSRVLLIATLLNGMSVYSHATPYVTAVIALLLAIDKKVRPCTHDLSRPVYY